MEIQKTSVKCAGTPGNFHAIIDQGKLLLPGDLIELVEESNEVRSVECLLSFFQCFPTTIWDGLGWTKEDFDAAQEALINMLKGHVRDEFLHPPPVPPRVYGVTGGRWPTQ